MKLKTAVELQISHFNHSGIVRIDINEYFCLNDLSSFYPHKRLNNWLQNDDTKEYIKIVENSILAGKPAIIAKRGKGGGTYAHKYVAMKYCMWLSKEFELEVIMAYESGKLARDNWNLKRILASESIKFQNEVIKENIIPKIKNPSHERFAYSNNADLLNQTIFGRKAKGEDLRGQASDTELELLTYATNKNAHYIEEGLDHPSRKIKVAEAVQKRCQRMIDDGKSPNQLPLHHTQ